MSHKSFKRKKIKEMESFLCAARMMGEGGGEGACPATIARRWADSSGRAAVRP